MKRAISRIGQALATIVVVSAIAFLLVELVPGDPAVAALGANATEEQYARARTEMGLDLGVWERFSGWIGDAARGNFGESLFPPQREVSQMLTDRLPVTIELAVLALLAALVVAIPAALWTAVRPGSWLDSVATGSAFAALSTPSFLAGLLVVHFFVFQLGVVRWAIAAAAVAGAVAMAWRGWGTDRRARVLIGAAALAVGGALFARFLPVLPRQGYARIGEAGLGENLRYLALPVLTLAITEFAVFLRILRADLIETLKQDFILAARAKGMSMSYLLFRHALRPSAVSLVTVVSITLGRLIGGSVVIETIFNIPGIGRMLIDAITTKDFPVVQAGVLVVAVVYVLMNTIIDLVYGVLDPRVRRATS